MHDSHRDFERVIISVTAMCVMAFADAVGFANAPHLTPLTEEEYVEVEQVNPDPESKTLRPLNPFASTETPEEPPFHTHPHTDGEETPNHLTGQALEQSQDNIPTILGDGYILILRPERITSVPHLVIDGVASSFEHIEVGKRGYPVIKNRGGENSEGWALAPKSAHHMLGRVTNPNQLSFDLEAILRVSRAEIATLLRLLAAEQSVTIGRNFVTSDLPADIDRSILTPILGLSDFWANYSRHLPRPPETWNSALTNIDLPQLDKGQSNLLDLKFELTKPQFISPMPFDWITEQGKNTIPLHTSIGQLRIFSEEELTAFGMSWVG